MGPTALPPGFRFHPTDEELVGYYLKRKVDGLKIELEVIPEVELYKFDPWHLPDKSFLPKRDLEWFFFCPRDRKYPNGSRTNRATKSGYWKATGKDRQIACHGSVTGLKKTLVFYLGRAPVGDRTDWVMHEYRICDGSNQGSSIVESPFALCRIVKRSEGQKTGEQPNDAKKKRSIYSTIKDANSVGIASAVPRRFISEKSQEMHALEGACDSSPRGSTLHASGVRIDLETVGAPKAHAVSSDLSCDTSKVEDPLKDQNMKRSMQVWQHVDSVGIPIFSSERNYTLENEFNNLDLVEYYSQSGLMTPFSGEINNSPQMFEYDSILHQMFEFPEQYRNVASQLMELRNATVAPPICREASLDGTFWDSCTLWLLEDSTVAV